MENKIVFVVFVVLTTAYVAHGQVDCTTLGAGRHPIPNDTTCQNYTYCVLDASTNTYFAYNYVCPTTSVFNPNTAQCTASTNYNCTATATPAPAVCTAEGFIADPTSTDCSSYVQCVLINGVFTQSTLDCPAGTFYNPGTTLCEATYTCATTLSAFVCTAAGRFPNTADPTCQTYTYCVLTADGTYVQSQYTCPSNSVFNPTTAVCTTSYTCSQ